MSSFHLRPVHENSPSPSASNSTATVAERSPQVKHPANSLPPPLPPPAPPAPTSVATMHPRRPLSPSSLRDVNLTQDTENAPRKYPAPPTGHELMALFPPAPPAHFPEMGPTSGYFQSQERAFFAQAGKEIVRVRVEIDMMPQETDDGYGRVKNREQGPHAAAPRTWPQLPPHAQHRSPPQSTVAPLPLPFPPNHQRQPRAGPSTMSSTSLFPMTSHPPGVHPPPNLHPPPPHNQPGVALRTPPRDNHPVGPGTKVEFQPAEEYREDPDEAWRRPMPYAERRRAGKHTKRVIVRN